MALIVYSLCALVALLCAGLLLVSSQAKRSRALFWCGLCFAVLAATNLLAVVDIADASVTLARWRLLTALLAVCLLLYGLIFEDE
jgi:hypothetical protein